MSSLQRLQIRGIRSFEEQNPETIEFYTPLTLVVGKNGSGKTTIIECLRYILTGLMPPNSTKGGAFIHDPNLRSVREILAQVKLQFSSTQGHRLIVTRSLSVTIKGKSRPMKTLDSNLRLKRHHETQNISHRVAEMDLLLPKYLGVSAAVIDNVIFCHQEDSLWPLSESGTLKKKFDAIFEAEKYTKAIKNIKDIAKQKKVDLQVEKVQEAAAKNDKDRAVKAQKRSIELRDRVEELRTECENLGRRMAKALDAAHKAHAESEGFAQLLATLEGKRIEARSKQSSINDLKVSLKEVSESDEWLKSTLAEFDQRQDELRISLISKKEKYIECVDEIKSLRNQLDINIGKRGKFQEAKEEYERQVMRRKQLVRDAAARHNIRGFEDLSNEALVEEFLFKLKKLVREQQTALDRARREHDVEKREAQSQVNKFTERKSALQENRRAASQQIARHNQELNQYQRRADEIQINEGSKAVIESRINDLRAKLDESRTAATTADWGAKLREGNTTLKGLEDTLSQLNDELVQGTKHASELARLAHVKQELNEHDRSLETLLGAHSGRINSIIGTSWEPQTLEQVHQDALDAAAKELSVRERERDTTEREMAQINFKIKTVRDHLAKKEGSAADAEKKIRAVIDDEPSEYEQCLVNAEINAEQVRSDTKGSKELHDHFLRLLQKLEDETLCRVCMRKFKDKNDKQYKVAQRYLEEMLKKQEKAIAEVQSDVYEQELKALLDIKVVYEQWKQLTGDDIPDLRKQVVSLLLQRDAMVAKVEKCDRAVDERQQGKREIESITKAVGLISKCKYDKDRLRELVETLSAKQSQQAGGRTLEDIQEEIQTINEEKRKAQAVVSQLTKDQDQAKTDLSRMELEMRDLNSELSSASFQLEKRQSLLDRVQEFQNLNQKQRETIEQIDADVQSLDPQIATATTRYEDVVARANASEKDLSHDASRLTESMQNLDLLNDQIQSYVTRGGQAQIQHVDRDIKNLENEIANVTSKQNDLIGETNEINDRIKDSESTQRQYSDNLKYRRDQRVLQQLTKEIEELSAHNAELDRDRLRAEAEKNTREHNVLSAMQSELMGEMKSKDAQLAEILNEYNVDMKDAPQRYREAHIKVETTKAAIDDLNRYGQALDKAIMKYHSLKMDEINSILEELWRATYQGTDVDTILIRAENDSAGAGKSYNYRVIMVKQGTEMDMRGRCSAGQKVLASIIIRLALAEVFSANCGLIALDEPTTNLDQPNIEALAKALHGIVKGRQEQSNFQLIVITHDETFLKHMQCQDFTDTNFKDRPKRGGAPREIETLIGIMHERDASRGRPIAEKRGFDYYNTPVRGVNIGGWLVLEPWITPSIFAQFPAGNVVDEFTLAQQPNAESILQEHWSTWATEEDFQKIASAGLNLVRIPIGYWAFTKYGDDPYIQGAADYLDQALDWAADTGLKVWIDLHGAPLSQNGFDNSGQRTKTLGWGTGDTISFTNGIIGEIADRYADNPVVAGIELLNEPMIPQLPGGKDSVAQYTQQGFDTINERTSTILQVGFLDTDQWDGFLTRPGGAILDTHTYQVFTDSDLALSPEDHIDKVYSRAQSWNQGQDKWIINGEWSAAFTDCAYGLNGWLLGSRFDGSFPGSTYIGSCTNRGNIQTWDQDLRTATTNYIKAQIDVSENLVQGWIFWNFKTESAGEWDFFQLLDNGIWPS
ncbi:hypothetical protein DV737_g3603, partial [Chaetothyriales sp. CBS 132003]